MSDIDGYITSATLYRELGQYEFSISILEAGYNIHKDTRLLSELVYILCQVEKTIPQARKRYYELKHVSQDPVVPFIVYR